MVIDVGNVANLIKKDIEDDVSKWFEQAVRTKARTASRRPSLVRGANGKKYSYAKWQNTGQLANNIKIIKEGKGKTVTDGTRASYSDGSYHGMYFLVEKKGMQDVKTTLKKGANYANSMKL